MKEIDKLVTGIIAIGLVSAFALHASGLAGLTTQAAKSAGLIEKTAING